jgi:hypothetical protein
LWSKVTLAPAGACSLKPGFAVAETVVVVDACLDQIPGVPLSTLVTYDRERPQAVVVELRHKPPAVLADAVVVDPRLARSFATEVDPEEREEPDQVVLDAIAGEAVAGVDPDRRPLDDEAFEDHVVRFQLDRDREAVASGIDDRLLVDRQLAQRGLEAVDCLDRVGIRLQGQRLVDDDGLAVEVGADPDQVAGVGRVDRGLDRGEVGVGALERPSRSTTSVAGPVAVPSAASTASAKAALAASAPAARSAAPVATSNFCI